MGKKFLVSGAGFRGFCDAIELSRIPGCEVTIVESASFFGGIMHSLDVKGFVVDKGVHVFDSIPRSLAEIVNEIMGGKTCEIDFVSESAFNGKVTEGFSLPDLNSLDDSSIKETIRTELLQLAKSDRKARPRNLHELFETRYGKTAGAIFSRIFKKVYGIGSVEVEPTAIAQTSMGRLKFLDDDKMLALKRSDPWLESVLAARRKSQGKIDDLVSIYPDDGKAMKGWCDRAVQWLESKGIRVYLGEKITMIEESKAGVAVTTDKRKLEVDRVIWSNDNVTALGTSLGFDASTVNTYQYGTPMVFMTMMTEAAKIKNFTYLQNFDPDGITYRTAAAGLFSKQVRNGISFITSECPVSIGSPAWENAEALVSQAWEEVQSLKIVEKGAVLHDSHVVRIPTTFKLAKLNYGSKLDELRDEVSRRTRRVLLRNVVPFFRRDIYLDSLKLREQLE
jgi:hypothetical protein